MLLLSDQIDQSNQEIGPKTKSLKSLLDAGFRVPPFLAIPSSALRDIVSENGKLNEEILNEFQKEIQENLKTDQYAVRSSALIEDGDMNSFAGQFLTKIAIEPENLSEAIREVLFHAHSFPAGKLEKFSLIIQEYIEADYAGICFARNPLGSREAVLEYHKGIGEDVVGGKIKPSRKSFYRNQEFPTIDLPNFQAAYGAFLKIEKLFGKPQDIEWCIKDGILYFLQSRSITSLTKEQEEEFAFLDAVLPQNTDFLFEKTGISEIAPRPTPFTFGLLELIYENKGPVHQTYANLGIKYSPNEFLKIIGNELYVDREEELKTLLPSYGYFPVSNLKPRWKIGKGFFQTIGNIYKLNTTSLKDYDQLFSKISEKLQSQNLKTDFSEALKDFLRDYETVFQTNLLAEKAIKKLEYGIKNEKISLAEILSYGEKLSIAFDSKDWKGNGLEISDESPFTQFNQSKDLISETKDYSNSLSEWKKKLLTPLIESAQKFNALREFGRCLTVKHINNLRGIVLDEAKRQSFTDLGLVYFTTISELQNQTLNEELCKTRKSEYDKYARFHFPRVLANRVMENKSSLLAVSPGKAQGRLTNLENLKDSKENILYVKILSPDLVQYFDQIQGIVSESGGLLSHLAIMAREKHIPVIVNFDLTSSGLQLGDNLEFDAEALRIEKREG